MSLPKAWAYMAQPLPNEVLLEREEEPLTSGRIVIPEHVRKGFRSVAALVVAVGDGAPAWLKPLVRVLIQSGINRNITFGRGSDQLRLYIARPAEIIAILPADETKVGEIGQFVRGRYPFHPDIPDASDGLTKVAQ
mgnify:CR=1 FL=1